VGRYFLVGSNWARLFYFDTLIVLGSLTVGLILLSILVRLKATLWLDRSVTLYVQRLDIPWLTATAKGLTFMGNSLTLAILAAAIFAASFPLNLTGMGIFMIWALAALPINAVLKRIFSRERPGEKEARILPGPRWGHSYPSGHSMGSAAFYGLASAMASTHLPPSSWRGIVVALIAILPLGVGMSRVYLGAHWFSDVVGGWAGGAVIAVTLLSVYSP
jgi:membrane-associated phospholipid phosphatase